MILLRFICMLFVFIDVIAASAAAVLLAIVMLRFLPVLIIVILACAVFRWLLKKVA